MPKQNHAAEPVSATLSSMFSAAYLQKAEALAKRGPQPLKLARLTVAYCRRSKEIENLSIDRQKERAAVYAQAHLNDEIARFYVDEGITGETADRPGFIQMMKDAEAGLFDKIVVEDVDRVGRSWGVIGNSWDIFKELGIQLHTVFKGGEVSNVDIAFKALAATEHQTALRNRSRDGVDLAISQGRVVGMLPWGYARDPYRKGVFRIDEATRPCIEWMFEARLQGMSIYDILMGLREIAPDPERLPKSVSQISRCLKNPMYKGVFTFRRTDQTLKGGKRKSRRRPPSEWKQVHIPHMQIIDREKWEAAYDSFKGVSQRQAGRRFLTGKVYCGSCGLLMNHGSAERPDPKLTCYDYARSYQLGKDQKSCPIRMVPVNLVRSAVINAIREELQDRSLEKEYQRLLDVELDGQRKAIEQRRRDLEIRRVHLKSEINRVADAMSLGSIPRPIAEERIQETADKWNEANDQLDRLPDLTKRLLIESTRRSGLIEVFDRITPKAALHEKELSTQERMERSVCRRLIKRVVIEKLPGTRSFRIRIDISNSNLLGIKMPENSSVPEVKTHIYYGHRWRDCSNEIVPTYNSGYYQLSDAEWEVISSKLSDDLAEIAPEAKVGARELVDLLVFAGSISLRRRYLRKYGLVNSSKVSRALGIILYSGLWKRIFDALEANFPDRKRTLNPGFGETFIYLK
jgi:site-specific DNA recombinase